MTPNTPPSDSPAPCPRCGAPLVSVTYYVEGRGHLVVWECRADGCGYVRVL